MTDSATTVAPSPAQVTADPQHFAATFLTILGRDKQLTPFRWNAAQAHFHAHRTGRDLVLKARQLGFSTYVQGEMFRRAVTATRTTMTMAHDDETTQKLRRMTDRFWEHCAFNGIQPARKLANATLTTYSDFGSESVVGTAGSLAQGRGGTYSDFHGSEVAFWKDAERIISGAIQGGNPDVVLESTPNGAQGYFYDLCMEALHGEGVWTLHFYPWWWDPTYRRELAPGETLTYTKDEAALAAAHALTPEQIAWRRYKQAELRSFFIQEYPEDPVTCFLTSGNAYFGDLSGVYAAPAAPDYNPEHRYAAGLDWGQENDYTVMIVLDLTARTMVDSLRVRLLSWSEIRRRVKDLYFKWHLPHLTAEKNSIGSVNIEELQKLKLTVIPFETTNETKAGIMASLYEALHGTEEIAPWTLQDWNVLKAELRSFVSTQTLNGAWRLAAAGDGHDDTVIALALAYYSGTHPVQVFL